MPNFYCLLTEGDQLEVYTDEESCSIVYQYYLEVEFDCKKYIVKAEDFEDLVKNKHRELELEGIDVVEVTLTYREKSLYREVLRLHNMVEDLSFDLGKIHESIDAFVGTFLRS